MNLLEIIDDHVFSDDLSTINLDYATTYYVSVTPYNAIGVPVNTCSETAFTTMLKPDNTKFGNAAKVKLTATILKTNITQRIKTTNDSMALGKLI